MFEHPRWHVKKAVGALVQRRPQPRRRVCAAQVVEIGIAVAEQQGREAAVVHLLAWHIPVAVIVRVLSQPQLRRGSGEHYFPFWSLLGPDS